MLAEIKVYSNVLHYVSLKFFTCKISVTSAFVLLKQEAYVLHYSNEQNFTLINKLGQNYHKTSCRNVT